MAMITDIEDYFSLGCGRCTRHGTPDCSTRRWIDGLVALRRICRDAGLSEHLKWAHPAYMHAGRNICVMGAFRDDFRLSLMNAALMKDPEGLLERQGDNTRHPDCFRFTDVGQVDAREPVIRRYLAEAMGYAEAGIKPAKESSVVAFPDELIEALDADPELAEAFRALTPGRQKSYIIHLNAAKQSATRTARILRGREKILAGKGATER